MKGSIIVIALAIGSVLGIIGYKTAIVSSDEPTVSKIGDIVYIHHHARVFTATYRAGKRSFEVFEDQRPSTKCKPRVEVGQVHALYYGCDPQEKLGFYPVMAPSLEELKKKKELEEIDLQPIIDDFATFRPMADAYYATH